MSIVSRLRGPREDVAVRPEPFAAGDLGTRCVVTGRQATTYTRVTAKGAPEPWTRSAGSRRGEPLSEWTRDRRRGRVPVAGHVRLLNRAIPGVGFIAATALWINFWPASGLQWLAIAGAWTVPVLCNFVWFQPDVRLDDATGNVILRVPPTTAQEIRATRGW